MSTISIPGAMAKMDGVFGCKAVRQKNADGSEVTVFQKRNLVEWVLDRLFDSESSFSTRKETIAALDEIAEKIKDADDGRFKKFTARYKSPDREIDFKEIKRMLAKSLEWEFPPTIFSRDNGNSADLSLAMAYKAIHLKNMVKSICREEYVVPLVPHCAYEKLTEDNLKGYCDALHDISLISEQPVGYEGNREVEIKVQLAAFEMFREKNIPSGDAPDMDIAELKAELQKLRQAKPARQPEQNYKDRYFSKLHQSAADGTFEIEILLDDRGRVSNENILMLVKALAEVEEVKNVKFKTRVPENAVEPTSTIETRVNKAYIDWWNARFDSFEH